MAPESRPHAPELALTAERPTPKARPRIIRILIVCDYTDAALANHAALPAEAAFMEKPFTAATLTRKVREILDSPR